MSKLFILCNFYVSYCQRDKTTTIKIKTLFTSSRYIDDDFFKLLSSVFLVVTVFARLAKLAADGHDDALGLKDLDGHEHRHLEKKQNCSHLGFNCIYLYNDSTFSFGLKLSFVTVSKMPQLRT